MVTKRKHFQIRTHHQYNFLSTLTTKPNLKIVVLKYLLYLPCQLHSLFLSGRATWTHACMLFQTSIFKRDNDHVRTWMIRLFK